MQKENFNQPMGASSHEAGWSSLFIGRSPQWNKLPANTIRIDIMQQTAAYELPWFRNCAVLRELTKIISEFYCPIFSCFGLFLTWLSIYVQKASCFQEFTAWPLPVLDFSQLNCSFMSKNPAPFRSSLPVSFLFWTFSWLDCPFMSKNPAAFKSSLPVSFLFWTFPNLIIHLCPKSRRIMYGENRRRESIWAKHSLSGQQHNWISLKSIIRKLFRRNVIMRWLFWDWIRLCIFQIFCSCGYPMSGIGKSKVSRGILK